ncbi:MULTISPECIES: hypothetical protein [Thermus]|jgi:hypothetical protein|uniref:Uncharacterized protein n=1 Tax=Thermus scotoductus TaxID=37636 RepID=A0A348XMZ7_THESC|nr:MULTISPECIES: hypothetical protein [Thermus]ETN87510.1 hypothetical protein TNMX_11790 [Thermus sp. NMX2.A1]RTG91795.1 hypothetical protein CSW49_14205 [Thermus scotoductus]RTH06679.1 hypothetical protein CSW45_01430 [Thermus scotoductus]RTH23038.1 hypothetical protein CSW42_01865 [Thermus scotoductus]RTI02609.1 hypothetical protein CSW28_01355 [Thermus scotoductus]
MPSRGSVRGFLVFLYLLLTLTASTGVALQMYLMQVQNPGLRTDLCQAPGEEREVDHSLFCGLQVSPGLPPIGEVAPPALVRVLQARVAPVPGYPEPQGRAFSPRSPPFALKIVA